MIRTVIILNHLTYCYHMHVSCTKNFSAHHVYVCVYIAYDKQLEISWQVSLKLDKNITDV